MNECKKLHLGCGDKILDGFINIDLRSLHPDVVIDSIDKLEKFNEKSIDLIYVCHVLEHFGRYEFKDVLKRWHSLLKPGGILRLAVPDIGKVCKMYSEGMEFELLIGFLYGGQTYELNYHYMGFTDETLRSYLLDAGFKETRAWDWRKTEHSAVDDFSQAYLPHMDKENGELMSLNIEAVA